MHLLYPEETLKAQKISMLGKADGDFTEYSIDKHIDRKYPPVYLVHCEDDDQVPFTDSLHFIELLKRKDIYCVTERHQKGGHGFGLGEHMDAVGWIERAVKAWSDRKPRG